MLNRPNVELSISTSSDYYSISSPPTTAASSSSFYSTPPFGRDEDHRLSSRPISQGYRQGGPKEARLKRTAFLSLEKDPSQLNNSVRIDHLPLQATPEKLKEVFHSYGPVQDVYIPMADPRYHRPAADFAIIRFQSSDSVDRVLSESASSASTSPIGFNHSSFPSIIPRTTSLTPTTLQAAATAAATTPTSTTSSVSNRSSPLNGLLVSPVKKQASFFSGGTGYHGINNEPVEDGTYIRSSKPVKQDIALESCLSRSGYPWGSIRELKYLPPHIPEEARETFGVRIENLDHSITSKEMEDYFSRYGPIASVSCPKPLVVAERVLDPNCGYAFVRFHDKRDAKAAVQDIEEGKVHFNGQQVTGHLVYPSYWPSEKTRTYY
eukprot:gene860-935_t